MSLTVSLTVRDDDDHSEDDCHCVFDNNITHNLNTMAGEAGIYWHMWRPDEIGITIPRQLIEPLTAGLKKLEENRLRFEKFNPQNGWGDYDGLVEFVREYLAACKEYPDADLYTSR